MLRPWPVCPPPEHDESLPSWVERIAREYRMSTAALLSSIESAQRAAARGSAQPQPERLQNPLFIERLTALSGIPDATRRRLWPPPTGWELQSFTVCAYCPQCCLDDIAKNTIPYGRLCWQQSWCTICAKHSYPLVIRNHDRFLSPEALFNDVNFLASNRYRDLVVPPNPKARFDILAGVYEIQTAIANALRGVHPSRWLWGHLAAEEFLRVVNDVTTWSLMHFESVRAWSVAEDLSPTEEQEGYGIIGRGRRMLASEYGGEHCIRTLRYITNPKVRGAALWAAHALMAQRHEPSSDRTAGPKPQDRQAPRIRNAPNAAREWLVARQQAWPPRYLEEFWIDASRSQSVAVQCDMDC
jgi:hypothetical protein